MCMLCWGKGGETAIASIYFTLFDRSHRPRTQSRGKTFFRSPIFSRNRFLSSALRSAVRRCPRHHILRSWLEKKKKKQVLLESRLWGRECSFKFRQSLKKNFKLEENFTQSTSSSSRLDPPFHRSKRLGPWDSGRGDLHPSPVPRGVLGERATSQHVRTRRNQPAKWRFPFVPPVQVGTSAVFTPSAFSTPKQNKHRTRWCHNLIFSWNRALELYFRWAQTESQKVVWFRRYSRLKWGSFFVWLKNIRHSLSLRPAETKTAGIWVLYSISRLIDDRFNKYTSYIYGADHLLGLKRPEKS